MALKQPVLDLATALAADIKVEGDKLVYADDIYAKSLPAGLTIEQVQAVADHNRIFLPAVHHASGLASIEAFKGKKAPESISGSFDLIPGDTASFQFNRKVSGTTNGVEWTKNCQSAFSFTTAAGEAGRGQLKASRVALNEAAAAAYGE